MAKILQSNTDIYQIDVKLLLEDITPEETEVFLGGYCDIDLFKNKLKKQNISGDDKYSKQKINSIDNSKKTYFNGVSIPRKGNTVIIYE
ncbi:hypothetical protein H6F39_11295 [Anabaena sp. FACHB-1250]|uniref:hypothetical protein n=1 Tax=unclassified Anabaena TaxID=2619674 RepID=UPI0016813D41|nr:MULTISPECIES: hypothetical protein [unclassified Anabaena]MBD2141938.1 hypothetical protein [Anabaena sp. FACHB-1250]MBD2269782.1 hypothetical protein [Anabaena sp. FACHB-1391]